MRIRTLLALALALLAPVMAQEQDESILVDISINYGAAYRDGSWVPVDVFVRNTERDVKGSIVVQTRGFSGEVQSPVYRLPAESPRQSQKRFRLYCKLDRVDSLEANLYHGNRSVLPGPARLQLTPIDRDDYMGLVLDDAHHDYGFLSSTEVIGTSGRRFHREGLTTDQLSYLAGHLSCYTHFDLVVLGNIDPERIDPAHRELLLQYVRMGGSLVVNLGSNADRYTGTWVADLLGVTIQANSFQGEPDLAVAALGVTQDSTGLSENREGMVTAITPNSVQVRPIGRDFQLGAVHPLGHGRVVTLTVDAASGLMIHQPDFLREWNKLLRQSMMDRPLSMSGVVEAAVTQMPRIAGVRLFPVSSVITYLVLYFVVAIVANWLFWNWMKRREMAWVCLVFFSLAFTSYAMIFGTQGRARTTQLEQLEILEVTTNNATAIKHGLTGLLAKGSGRFDATLVHPNSLLSDATDAMALGAAQPGGLFGPQGQTPFEFVQASPAQVRNLAVGASEMRFVRTETPLFLEGPIESDLRTNEQGLFGTLTNRSGLRLRNPTLYVDGQMKPLQEQQGSYAVEIARQTRAGVTTQNLPSLAPMGAYAIPPDAEPPMGSQFSNFLMQMPALALQVNDRSIPPCFIAWVDGPPFGSLDMGSRASLHLGATLLVAWLEVEDERAVNRNPIPLSVMVIGSQTRYRTNMPLQPDHQLMRGILTPEETRWDEYSMDILPGESLPLGVSVPEWALGQSGYAVELTVVAASPTYHGTHRGKGHTCQVMSPGQSQETGFQLALMLDTNETPVALPTTDTRRTEQSTNSGITYSTTTYRLDDWAGLVSPRSGTLRLLAEARDGSGATLSDSGIRSLRGRNSRNSRPHFHAYVAARIVSTPSEPLGD